MNESEIINDSEKEWLEYWTKKFVMPRFRVEVALVPALIRHLIRRFSATEDHIVGQNANFLSERVYFEITCPSFPGARTEVCKLVLYLPQRNFSPS